jgi:1-aminocyclopropane-1-carboxylate deaminase/D-cysteine desulfhydrase-like pyridoxal-dependent ACC family enzyme
MANTKAIGVAFLDQDITGADFVSAGTVYATSEIGYAAAAQGTVTQATSKSTGVTLNKSAGQITMNGAALAGATAVSFTLTNSTLSAKDVIVVCISGGGTAAAYTVYVSSMAAGSAVITLRNLTAATSLSEAVVINFAIIHGA